MKKASYLFAIAALLLTASCARREVQRIPPDEKIDLSGRWNDTDSRRVSETMIDQVLYNDWLENYTGTHDGDRPVVVVGMVKNKSHEHIATETFIKNLERAFIQSGKVRVVQAGEEREEIREERADQQEFASPDTMKDWGRELGADFMMQGTINSIVDQYRDEKVVFYQVNLELTNLETNEIVWIGEKEIKKLITD